MLFACQALHMIYRSISEWCRCSPEKVHFISFKSIGMGADNLNIVKASADPRCSAVFVRLGLPLILRCYEV